MIPPGLVASSLAALCSRPLYCALKLLLLRATSRAETSLLQLLTPSTLKGIIVMPFLLLCAAVAAEDNQGLSLYSIILDMYLNSKVFFHYASMKNWATLCKVLSWRTRGCMKSGSILLMWMLWRRQPPQNGSLGSWPSTTMKLDCTTLWSTEVCTKQFGFIRRLLFQENLSLLFRLAA